MGREPARVRRVRRRLTLALGVLAAPWLALGACAATKPLPPALAARAAGTDPTGEALASDDSLELLDRDGALLAHRRTDDGKKARHTRLEDFGTRLPDALLAAEDRRFRDHLGVDPIALVRAGVDSVRARRVVSGASTITQQLARTLGGTERTVSGKLDVMATALRIEASLDKDAILEAYLNHVEFGPNLRGAEAASRHYFDKSAKDLSLAEAAALAGMPRGPSLYDPTRRPELLVRRRDRVLDRMAAAGFVTEEEATRAKGEPLALSRRSRRIHAPHFVELLASGQLASCGEAAPPTRSGSVRTTLLGDLQIEAQEAVRDTVRALEDHGVAHAAVVVLDNVTGELLAYVGSPGLDAALGHNDGARALRQPGSALKPFVYALAFEKLGVTPATMLPDVELSFPTPDGSRWTPRNYDQRFHGPVSAREALGSSLNVPAVHLADRLGPGAILERLRELGLCTLDREPAHYGLGLALGDGEVRLLDLANAYATLARGGRFRPIRARLDPPEGAPTEPRVVSSAAAELVTHVLSDAHARAAAFGASTVFDLPFEVAVKTGTSKGYRDNLAVGYTPEVTVAVWVGNFDGSPMRGVSGITGAGPLFARVMLAAARVRPPSAFPAPQEASSREVCALSGLAPGPSCPHTVSELVPSAATHAERCALHRVVLVDRRDGRRAGRSCPAEHVEERVIEDLPALYGPWARAAGRDPNELRWSERCPPDAAELAEERRAPRIVFPADGARFYLDRGQGAAPAIVVRAEYPASTEALLLLVDGRRRPLDPRDGRASLSLEPGEHQLVVVADGRESPPVRYSVD